MIAAVCVVAVAVAAWALLGRDGSSESEAGAETEPATLSESDPGESGETADGRRDDPAPEPEGIPRSALAETLEGVVADSADGAGIRAALMVGDWRRPLTAASPGVDEDEELRMWSVSKVVTAVTLLLADGWGDHVGAGPSREVHEAIQDAFVRSENCRQRRVVLDLQATAGGIEEAQRELERSLRTAGVKLDVAVDADPAESLCHEYLLSQEDLDDPLGPGLLLGTATWTIGDAASFMHALGSDAYGTSIADHLLALLRIPKRRSREAPRSDFTADVDWGAGNALGKFDPAYKAGWGGTQQGEFITEQIALVTLEDGSPATIAVAVEPDAAPAIDDPGLTVAPQVTEDVMRGIAKALPISKEVSTRWAD